jgi:HEAT repeat protein
LGEVGSDAADAVPILLHQLETIQTHRPSRTPSFAAIALGQLGPTAVPGLVKLIEHAVSDVRVNAAAALGGQGTAAAPAVPGLIRMLSAADLEEQMAAANALGEIGPVAEPAVPELTRLANLETTQDVIVGHVRSAARDALERIRVPPAAR